jgi:aminoglycoside 2'-N-acetyltransferase I
VTVEVALYRELARAELDEWERLARKAHPPDEPRLGSDLTWADLSEDTDYLLRLRDDDGELRACAWVTKEPLRIDDEELRVAGIRGVLTDPDRRRRGYGRAVMERAHEVMRSFGDCDFALLFSSVMAVPFYERLGWRAIPGPLTCDQPGGRIDYTATLPTAPVMVLELQAATFPSGPVHVYGLPW